mmetsp:Transcript_14842/g.40836  ORF Transcript_14842/g.40836 Transcript_14842/m.40836 type:complete len:298 (-) Transcript_14842:22-915(-)
MTCCAADASHKLHLLRADLFSLTFVVEELHVLTSQNTPNPSWRSRWAPPTQPTPNEVMLCENQLPPKSFSIGQRRIQRVLHSILHLLPFSQDRLDVTAAEGVPAPHERKHLFELIFKFNQHGGELVLKLIFQLLFVERIHRIVNEHARTIPIVSQQLAQLVIHLPGLPRLCVPFFLATFLGGPLVFPASEADHDIPQEVNAKDISKLCQHASHVTAQTGILAVENHDEDMNMLHFGLQRVHHIHNMLCVAALGIAKAWQIYAPHDLHGASPWMHLNAWYGGCRTHTFARHEATRFEE